MNEKETGSNVNKLAATFFYVVVNLFFTVNPWLSFKILQLKGF